MCDQCRRKAVCLTMETFLKACDPTNLRIGISGALMTCMMPVIDRFKNSIPSVRDGPFANIAGDFAQRRNLSCGMRIWRLVSRKSESHSGCGRRYQIEN